MKLLLLPGMLSDAAFWQKQIQALNGVCIPLVPEYGSAASIADMAQKVLSGAPSRFLLVGHSMGGRVALELCKRAPGRVSKLGLFCTDYRGHSPDDEGEQASRSLLLSLAHSEGLRALGRTWAEHVVAPHRRSDRSLISAIADMAARHSIQQLEAEIHAGKNRPDYTADLRAITCSTLICAGGNDTMRPVNVHQDMAAAIPRSRLVVFPESGHMIAMEEPDALSSAMRMWIEEQHSPA